MAHKQQKEFCLSVKERHADYFRDVLVLDVGALDINGNNHYLFEDALYLGVDVAPGRNVDIVSMGHELALPDETFDVIVSTECFEHDRHYEETLRNICRLLKPGGMFLFTCATEGRAEHGTRRTTPQDAPLLVQHGDWQDYYRNLTEKDIRGVIDVDRIFSAYEFSVEAAAHDLYFWGIKKGEFSRRRDYSFHVSRPTITAVLTQEKEIAVLRRKVDEIEAIRRAEAKAFAAQAEELREELRKSGSDLAESARREEALRAEAKATAARAEELRETLLRSDAALSEARRQEEARRKDVAAGAREIGGLQERLSRLDTELAGAKKREDGLRADLSARDANVGRLEAEAAETKAALDAERAGRAAAEAETARLVEAWREFDDPAVRSLARVVRRSARLGRRMKALATRDGVLPGRRRQRRQKPRRARDAELIAASGLFDREWYLRTYPDVAAAGEDPLLHYLQHGVAERRNPNPLFDTDWYLRQYPDVAAAGANPLVHFVTRGAAEKRDPGPDFSTAWYLDRNPDVAEAGENALRHFLVYGQAEGRQPVPMIWGYEQWQAKFDYRSDQDKEDYFKTLAEVSLHPRISILMPVYNPKPTDLEAAIQSVVNQIYPNWELCIADDASTDENVRAVLGAAAELDSRIKIVYRESNGHISEATNSAFALASGEYVGLLDHDDVLREHALAEVVIAINDHPDVELLYSDEDKLSAFGERYDAFFKPDFSPDLFYAMNYLNHFTVHRAENIRKVGGWRKGFEGSQDYDINLRIIETIDPRRIIHIPKILYHWRATEGSTARAGSEKNYAYAAGFRALEDHVVRCNLPAKVEDIEGVPFYRLRWDVPRPEPLVSLIIPTRDMVDVLRTCVSSIIDKTTYPNYEILVVDNESGEEATHEYFAEISNDPRIRVLSYAKPFNYSAINNFAAHQARGSILGLINNDIEVIEPEWLEEMVAHAMRPEIGCVGAKLLYPDDTIQHAGVVLGIGGVANHAYLGYPRNSTGYFGRLCVAQNFSAVTAACMLLRAEVFWQVGGLDEKELAIAFNDIDLCLKVREAGYLNLFTPFALLYHHESLSRGPEDTPEKKVRFAGEVAIMEKRWGEKLTADPFYSPNLTLDREDFSLRIS